MTKATEGQLSALHGRVAETLINTLDQADVASGLLIKHDGELPNDVVNFLESVTQVHPSLLTVATKFLKDNNISVDAAEDGSLADLQKQLNKRGSIADMPYDA